MAYEQYAHNRDALLQHILTFLQSDERFVAAWLTGSFGRGTEDNLSDFDLRVVVADAYVASLCSCEPNATTRISSEARLTLYKQFGEPLVLREDASFPSDGEGGCFNHVVYRETAMTVDWVLIPRATAKIPSEECHPLFDKVGLPMRPPLVAENLEERIAQASRDIGFFWLMTNIGIKYMLRGNTVALYGFLGATYYTLQEVKRLVAGEPQRYNHGSIKTLAITSQEQVVLIRQLCNEMLEVMEQAAALGAYVPDDPMSVTEVWLSMAKE
jgi:predicted nucleotidyltransferase